MKTSYKFLSATFGGLALALLLAPNSIAQCGKYTSTKVSPASWSFQPYSSPGSAQPRLLLASLTTHGAQSTDDDFDDEAGDERYEPPGHDGIVGLWHVKFFSKGSEGIPDGTEIDAGFRQWHSDETEVLFSAGRKPSTGDVCLGIWKKVAHRKYKLSHFVAPWNDAETALIGPGVFHETLTLNKAHDRYKGTFTFDQYDESGNKLGHVTGLVYATRLDIDTSPFSIF